MAARSLLNIRALRTAAPLAVPRAHMPLSTTARLSLKESSSQTDVDYEKHKQDSLEKQKRGNAHWKPELASDSEEAVRADRAPKSDEDTARLQERTKRAAEESAKAGTSVKDEI